MLESLRKKGMSKTMIKHFLLVMLLYPLYGSSVGSPFAPDVVYANIFVVAFGVLSVLEGSIDWKRRSYLVYVIAFFLVCFNAISLYVNIAYFDWYAGQLNVTIAFLFLIAWLLMKDSAPGVQEDLIKFLLITAAITNLIGVIPGLLGYSNVEVQVDGYHFTKKLWWNPEYGWIFHHKSEYSFFLLLFIALTVTYRRLYEKRWQFWATLAIYVVALIGANTRVTMLSALFILASVMMDYLVRRAGGFRWKYLLWLAPIAVAGIIMLWFFAKDRDVFTLGLRTYIWKEAIEIIRDNPWGHGPMWGLQPFRAENVSFELWNCHNVFLNILLQFSIPAGFFYIMMMVAAFVASIWKNRSFTTLGIWVALLIPLNMDWCVLLGQMPLMLMILYFIFFHPLRNAPEKKE